MNNIMDHQLWTTQEKFNVLYWMQQAWGTMKWISYCHHWERKFAISNGRCHTTKAASLSTPAVWLHGVLRLTAFDLQYAAAEPLKSCSNSVARTNKSRTLSRQDTSSFNIRERQRHGCASDANSQYYCWVRIARTTISICSAGQLAFCAELLCIQMKPLYCIGSVLRPLLIIAQL